MLKLETLLYAVTLKRSIGSTHFVQAFVTFGEDHVVLQLVVRLARATASDMESMPVLLEAIDEKDVMCHCAATCDTHRKRHIMRLPPKC